MKTCPNLPWLPCSSANSTQDSIVHGLQDSRSAINLTQGPDHIKKVRQTTYFPNSTKNMDREFLRYTVNLNKSGKEGTLVHVQPLDPVKIKRKLTVPEPGSPLFSSQEYGDSNSKSGSTKRKVQKKYSNPETTKQEASIKPSPLPKFLQKKILAEEKTTATKTQRVDKESSPRQGLTPKKTFTPKCDRSKNQHQIQNKIIASYSSNNLFQNKGQGWSAGESALHAPGQKQVLRSETKIDDFIKVKFVGEGKFGQVYLALHKQTHSLYALKQIRKSVIAQNKMQEQLLMQIKMQFHFNHPNILKLYGVFHDEEHVYLVLEYMEEGTLYSQLKKKKVLGPEEASRKIRDVLDGMSYLHGLNIAHRDIKPENIVISNNVCKICDLGWAANCDDRRKTLCGTIDYASPELLEGKQYGISIDLWCLGVLAYELTVGKCPFYHISRKQTMRKIINADLSDISLPASLAVETKDFILKLLRKKPEDRMSAEAALFHPLITSHIDSDMEELRRATRRKH